MIEGDGAEQLCQWNAESFGNFMDSLIGNQLVAIVISVQGGQQWCRLVDPAVNETAAL